MTQTLLVLLGGGIGAAGRYWVSVLVQSRSATEFPWGTLTVNAIGSFCIGIAWYLLEQHDITHGLRLFFIAGVLGGFTTYSAFSMETFNLLREGAIGLALFNVLISNIVCIGLAFLGYSLTRMVA